MKIFYSNISAILCRNFHNVQNSAVIQLGELSPELKDFMRNRVRVKSESFRKTVQRKASIPKLKNLSRKNSTSHLGQQKGASSILRKMIDRSFCLAEHLHEWSLSQIGKVR